MEGSSILAVSAAEQLYNRQNMKLLLNVAINMAQSQSQALSSISIPDAQPDPFREYFRSKDP